MYACVCAGIPVRKITLGRRGQCVHNATISHLGQKKLIISFWGHFLKK